MTSPEGNNTAPSGMLTRAMTWAFLAFAVIVIVEMIIVLAVKGIWFDEVWSLFVARHDLPLSEIYLERWRWDVHPPLFHFAAWLFEPLTGENIVARRLLNFVPLIIALLAAGLIALRRPQTRVPLIIAAVIILPNPLAFNFFVEHRSYYALISAWFIACSGLLAIALENRDYERSDRWLALLIVPAAIVTLNLHYFCALVAGVMLGAFIISEWVQGRRRWASWLFLSGVLGSIFLLTAAYMQREQLAAAGGYLEWSTSTFGAIKVAASDLAIIFGLNLAALFALLPLVRARRDRSVLAIARESRRARFVIAGFCAIGAAIIVAVIANAVHSMLLRRYLMPLLPVGGIMLGVAVADRLSRHRLLYAAVLANGLLVATAFAVWGGKRQNWNELAQHIGTEVRACPGTRVLAVPDWLMKDFRPPPISLPDEAMAFGYEMLGDRYGFDPLIRSATAEPLAPSRECPTIVWAEHYQMFPPLPALVADRARLTVTPEASAGAVLRRSQTGFVMIFPVAGAATGPPR